MRRCGHCKFTLSRMQQYDLILECIIMPLSLIVLLVEANLGAV